MHTWTLSYSISYIICIIWIKILSSDGQFEMLISFDAISFCSLFILFLLFFISFSFWLLKFLLLYMLTSYTITNYIGCFAFSTWFSMRWWIFLICVGILILYYTIVYDILNRNYIHSIYRQKTTNKINKKKMFRSSNSIFHFVST